MLRALLYHAQQNTVKLLDENEILDCALKSDSVPCAPLEATEEFLWIDADNASEKELELLSRRFKLDPQIMEDISGREGRPKLHDYEEYIYVVFHAISFEENEAHRDELKLHEVDCLVGPDWVLTLHAEEISGFHDIARRWQKRPEWMHNGPGHLLYELMDIVLDAYFPVLEALDERIDEFEDRLYKSSYEDRNGPTLSSDIFGLKRALLQLRHVAGPTRDVANVLLRRDAEAGGKHFAAFQDLYDHAARIVENIDTYRDILSGALDAYLASESNRMNAVMKRLTAYSIILLLPSLISGVYGMNFDDLPHHHGFYDAIGAMAFIIAGLFVFFKARGWL